MLAIDGSLGEGGGQILRTALALSLVTGKAFRITHIRARRKRPGLLHQHLTAVSAAAEIGHAQVEGASLGSQYLSFTPGRAAPGSYRFSTGTAGSVTLVLQTVLPGLLAAGGQSRLVLEGGTHNPSAPPFEFLARAFLPLIERLGPRIEARLLRPGFYPAGGGCVDVAIDASPLRGRLDLRERGPLRAYRARALISGLPPQIAEREARVLRRQLGWEEPAVVVELVEPARGPGNVVIVELEHEGLTEVFTAFGRKGVRAEAVAEEAAAAVRRYLDAGVPVGEHLADQLLLPLAMAGGGSFVTLPLSDHARTNAQVISMFLNVDLVSRPLAGEATRVELAARP